MSNERIFTYRQRPKEFIDISGVRPEPTPAHGASFGRVKWPLLLTSVVLAGCASAPPSTAHSGASKSGADDFEAMTWEDRHDEMTWVVLPTMAKHFQAFTGAADATLTCRTCHGPDPESVSYRMPRELSALDPLHLPQPNDTDPRGRTTKFMIETVTPTMADLLGEPLYDAKTQRGFGCFKCHPAVGAGASNERSAP